MKKLFVVCLILAVSSSAVWAQGSVVPALKQLAKSSVQKNRRRAARLEPLSNARIEALAGRGK